MATTKRMSTSEILGQNVKRLRTERGWTQWNLADRIERDQARVSEIERAAYPVGCEIIDALAKAFGVPPSELLAECEPE